MSRPEITFPITEAELWKHPFSLPVFVSAFYYQFAYYRNGVNLPIRLSFNLARRTARSLAHMYWYLDWRKHVNNCKRIWSALSREEQDTK